MMGWASFESICIFLFALCLTMVSCGGRMKPCTPYTKPHKAGVCGSKIDEALEILCGEGGFVERKYRKRSVSGIEPDILDLDAKTFLALHKQQNAQLDNDNKQPIVDILLPESKASSFLDKRVSFYRKGISCECCYHSCTVGELASYCKSPGKSSLRSWFNI